MNSLNIDACTTLVSAFVRHRIRGWIAPSAVRWNRLETRREQTTKKMWLPTLGTGSAGMGLDFPGVGPGIDSRYIRLLGRLVGGRSLDDERTVWGSNPTDKSESNYCLLVVHMQSKGGGKHRCKKRLLGFLIFSGKLFRMFLYLIWSRKKKKSSGFIFKMSQSKYDYKHSIHKAITGVE